ncbi:MAG: carboxypeptidase-like regulatory domain-containing protein, partial [Terracidiphilus sp.]
MKAQIGGSGAIEGTVSDSTGALVVGAKVVAQNTATGVETSRITSKNGLYNLSPLDAGDYSVVVSAAGFETLVREDIHLDGMQALSLNLTLQIGAATQTITVKDEPPPLETENATLGAAMENEVYQSLPLEMGAAGAADQRRATDFAALMPGVTANFTKNNETDEPMVINGNQNSSEMYLEGIPMSSVSVAGDPRYIWSAFSVETVDQFQLKTSAYSAEYRGLGIENYTIKSGGNQFHGSVYDVLRNTAFDAVGFIPALDNVATAASKAAGGGNVYVNSPAPEHMNEYGISLGGPIIKKKLFFFANYLGYRFSTVTNPSFYTVPTTLMRTGNFSELLNTALVPGGVATGIYDPITQTCTATTKCTRTVYPNNVIPASEISPIAQAMQQYLPAPTNSNVTGNYLGSVPWGLN